MYESLYANLHPNFHGACFFQQYFGLKKNQSIFFGSIFCVALVHVPLNIAQKTKCVRIIVVFMCYRITVVFIFTTTASHGFGSRKWQKK
jgi:hypothetical protein